MLLIDSLTQSYNPVPAGISAWSRIGLGSGRLVGMALLLPTGFGVETALDAACSLALADGVAVSVPAHGPLSALPALAAAALRRSGLAPDQLEIAVTATQLDDAGVEGVLALSALRDLGITTALAAFCNRSAAQLPRLPVMRVVLAPEVLDEVPGVRAANSMLHALVTIARRQGLQVTATQIETETQRAILSGFGCDQGEGTLFGPPQPVPMLHAVH